MAQKKKQAKRRTATTKKKAAPKKAVVKPAAKRSQKAIVKKQTKRSSTTPRSKVAAKKTASKTPAATRKKAAIKKPIPAPQQSPKRPLMKRVRITAAISIIAIGLLSLAIPPMYYPWSHSPVTAVAPPQSSNKPTDSTPGVMSGRPVGLQIPSLAMSLPVAPGYYDPETKEWTLSLDKAHYAEPSTQPNNHAGNTLIYGHYRPEVFARLHTIQPGAEVIVTTYNHLKFTYRYDYKYDIKPSDTSIFSYKGAPRLTLQTCSGAWFQNRQLYVLDFVRVEPA